MAPLVRGLADERPFRQRAERLQFETSPNDVEELVHNRIPRHEPLVESTKHELVMEIDNQWPADDVELFVRHEWPFEVDPEVDSQYG